MLGKITREALEGYLNCKYKAYLELAGEKGTISAYGQLIKEATILIRQTATEKLCACHREPGTKGINRLDRASLKQGLPQPCTSTGSYVPPILYFGSTAMFADGHFASSAA